MQPAAQLASQSLDAFKIIGLRHQASDQRGGHGRAAYRQPVVTAHIYRLNYMHAETMGEDDLRKALIARSAKAACRTDIVVGGAGDGLTGELHSGNQ